MREPIEVDHTTQTLKVPHLGYTLRVLIGAAATWDDPAPGEIRAYTVKYRGAPVAVINIKQHEDLAESHG